MRRSLTARSLKLKDSTKLTPMNCAHALIRVMPEHIGKDNAISKKTLYRKMFGQSFDTQQLEDWLRWEYIKRGLHLLRQRSNCFVVSMILRDNLSFFVLKTQQEAKGYIDYCENIKDQLAIMQKRAKMAVENRWYKQDWKLKDKRFIPLRKL